MFKNSACHNYSGEQYIICTESNFEYSDREPHPGPSSASGPYGLLNGTRRDFHCSNKTDRECATDYMLSRYGSWSAAENFHRKHRSW